MARMLPITRLPLILWPGLFVLAMGVSLADEEEDDVGAESGSYLWQGGADGWTITQGFADIRGYADRPGEETLQAITVAWQQPTFDALGNFCTVRGRLEVPSDELSRRQPVHWFQGITVYMGRAPGARPDWSEGIREEDTLNNTALLRTSGEFSLRLDLSAVQFDRTVQQSFQFGLALARHTGSGSSSQVVIWESRAPAIPSTVQLLAVPAIARLSREVELINRANRWPFDNPDGVRLVQAVNVLQRLDKERALAALEEYIKLTETGDHFDATEKSEIVFWVVHALFEPIRADERIPVPGIAVFLVHAESPQAANWPLDPMAIIDDVPFMVGVRCGSSGRPEPPERHIAWARRHAVIRDQPLKPTTNPLSAAQTLLDSRQFEQLEQYDQRSAVSAIRSQALAIVSGILPPFSEKYLDKAEEDQQWAARVDEAKRRAIRWDTEQQQFVEGGK